MAIIPMVPISEEEVHAAADAINAAGLKPSFERVRQQLKNRGSYSTIRKYLETWVPTVPAPDVLPPPEAVTQRASEFVAQFWALALGEAQKIADKKVEEQRNHNTAWERDFGRLSETADEVANERDQLKAREAALVTQVATQDSELTVSRAEAAEFRGKFNAAHAEALELRKALTQLANAIGVQSRDRGKKRRQPEEPPTLAAMQAS